MGKEQVWWKRNERAIKYEKAGEMGKAIKLYEQNVADRADTPHSYKRLVILYKKQGRTADERRVAQLALASARLQGKKKEFFLKRLGK